MFSRISRPRWTVRLSRALRPSCTSSTWWTTSSTTSWAGPPARSAPPTTQGRPTTCPGAQGSLSGGWMYSRFWTLPGPCTTSPSRRWDGSSIFKYKFTEILFCSALWHTQTKSEQSTTYFSDHKKCWRVLKSTLEPTSAPAQREPTSAAARQRTNCAT